MSDVGRRAVERRAMHLAHEWLLKVRGAEPTAVRNTSGLAPYDFEVGPEGSPQLRVVVKGMLAEDGPVEVTADEVASAEAGGVLTALVVCRGIKVRATPEGLRAFGGELLADSDWRPSADVLTPTSYRCEATYVESVNTSLDDMMCGYCGAEDARLACGDCGIEYATCAGEVVDDAHEQQTWWLGGYCDSSGNCPVCAIRRARGAVVVL